MNYKVYVYTNKINGKKYVGQTSRTLEQRAERNGIGYKKCTKFWNAILKYGWENFEPNILYDDLTKEQANEIEIKLIRELKTQDDNFGYNIKYGGNSSNPLLQKPVIQFTLDMKYVARYSSVRNAIKKSGANPAHISSVCNSICDYKNSKCKQSGGYIWMWEADYINHRYNINEILETINREFEHPNARRVVQLCLNMEYISTFKNICDASRKTGCRRNSINDTCTHRLRTSGGYIWMYEDEYIKHNYNENDIVFNAKRLGKKVVQLDLNMNFIRLYASTAEASRETGIDRSYISDTCKGKYKKAKGYKFMYENDYISNL